MQSSGTESQQNNGCHELGEKDVWHWLYTDDTSRRQTEMQNLIIAVKEEGETHIIDPVVVLSCMYLEDGTSLMQVKSIVDKVSPLQLK